MKHGHRYKNKGGNDSKFLKKGIQKKEKYGDKKRKQGDDDEKEDGEKAEEEKVGEEK
jgi:hypothetical protein